MGKPLDKDQIISLQEMFEKSGALDFGKK